MQNNYYKLVNNNNINYNYSKNIYKIRNYNHQSKLIFRFIHV